MFLSQIILALLILFFFAIYTIFGEGYGYFNFFREIFALGLLVAAVKLGRNKWIWIGLTKGQARIELEEVNLRIEDLDRQIFSLDESVDFTPAPNSQEILRERRKLFARRDRLQEIIGTHSDNQKQGSGSAF